MTVKVVGGVRVASNTRGPEDPIREFDLPVKVREVESSINCGFRAEWGRIDDVDGRGPLTIFSGAGLGSPWATISFEGKEYAIGAHDLADRFIEAVTS